MTPIPDRTLAWLATLAFRQERGPWTWEFHPPTPGHLGSWWLQSADTDGVGETLLQATSYYGLPEPELREFLVAARTYLEPMAQELLALRDLVRLGNEYFAVFLGNEDLDWLESWKALNPPDEPGPTPGEVPHVG